MPLATGQLHAPREPVCLVSSPRRAAELLRGRPLRSPQRQLTRSTASPQIGREDTASEEPQQITEKAVNLEQSRQLVAEFGTASIPHPDKASYGGEDAFFTSPVGGGAFGVADGVGGWQESGINPAEYSRTFMRLACAFLEGKEVGKISVGEIQSTTSTNASLPDSPPAENAESLDAVSRLSPQGALKAAHDGTRLPGSTTACVVRLDRAKKLLTAANVGDSGFLILRGNQVAFRSPPLQHFFDCPLQFAAFPDYTSATDNAEDAGLYDIQVQEGDVIVAGTDGLWDNVHQEEIISVLQQNTSNIQQAADALARTASEHANDKKFSSPYSQEARKQGIDIPWVLRIATASFADGKFKLGHMKGGKLDDITVVTAMLKEVEVRKEEAPADQQEVLKEEAPAAQQETVPEVTAPAP